MERKHWTRSRRWSAVLVAAVSIFATVDVVSRREPSPGVAQPQPAGSEIADQGGAYGWYEALAVGTRFTDGLNYLDLSSAATSPLTILSVTPLMDDGPALRVLGTLIRVIPDMRPKNSEYGWFQQGTGFPPKEPYAAGGIPGQGYHVRPAHGNGDVKIEIQIGYEVAAAGVSNRTGVEVIYEFQGVRKRVIIPSHLTICAPAKVACKPQD